MKSLLLPILTPQQCSLCKFCCSFAEFEAWETPLFTSVQIAALIQKYGDFPVKKAGDHSWTFDFSSYYNAHPTTDNYFACPFLRKDGGCILTDEEKPFDCKIWPLRIMKIQATQSNKPQLVIALTPTCSEINKRPLEEVKAFVEKSGIAQTIASQAAQMPDMIKEYHTDFPILYYY